MWSYERRLQYPVNIKQTNPELAMVIISQFGGPDGELAASMRYLSQRYAMKNRQVAGVLTDIGTEELAHMEIVSAIVHQLTCNLTPEQIEGTPFANYYVDHTLGIWPQAASGARGHQLISSRRATRSRISMRIWQQSRKHAPPMIIF